MSQSLARILVHAIFSTKDRFAFFRSSDIRRRAHGYLAKVFNECDSPALEVGGWHDHVHILCSLGRNHAIADVIAAAKRSSSVWLKSEGMLLGKFQWQVGYGAFSVSPSQADKVKEYILRQEDHHRVRTFQQEYLDFLKEYNVPYDERYLWK